MLGMCAGPAVAVPPPSAAKVLFVAVDGNDAHPGTEARPFRTITRAQDVARAWIEEMTDDITVYLREGVYVLTEPLRFDHRDSGMGGHRVIYRSYPGERAVLSGGQRLDGWVPDGPGVYRAFAGGRRFRQLYVDGVRGIRARHPNEPEFARLVRWDEATRRIVVPDDTVGPWAQHQAVEMVILKQWTQDNLRVESADGPEEDRFIVPREPDRSKAFLGHLFLRFESQSFYFENALELLDKPGEWFLQDGTDEVLYRPREGEDLAHRAVIVPVLERLVEIAGTPADPVHDMDFRGLTFEYSGWTQPSREGFVIVQADAIFSQTTPMGGRVPAAVHVEHAERLTLEGNLFRRLGGTALTLDRGVNDTKVIGNRVEDVSGSGIVLDGFLHPRPIDPRLPSRNTVISNNVVQRIGLDYRSSVGIFVGYASDTIIEHNEIHDTPYTGISVGWGWTDARTLLARNRIRWNHIYSVMTSMADGGGIYTLSYQPGTVIQGNYIHDIVRSPWAGHAPISALYLDEGSSGIAVLENVLERVPMGIFFHHASRNRVVNTPGSYEERWEAEDNEIRDTPDYDPAAVKARAGLEPAYAYLRQRE